MSSKAVTIIAVVILDIIITFLFFYLFLHPKYHNFSDKYGKYFPSVALFLFIATFVVIQGIYNSAYWDKLIIGGAVLFVVSTLMMEVQDKVSKYWKSRKK